MSQMQARYLSNAKGRIHALFGSATFDRYYRDLKIHAIDGENITLAHPDPAAVAFLERTGGAKVLLSHWDGDEKFFSFCCSVNVPITQQGAAPKGFISSSNHPNTTGAVAPGNNQAPRENGQASLGSVLRGILPKNPDFVDLPKAAEPERPAVGLSRSQPAVIPSSSGNAMPAAGGVPTNETFINVATAFVHSQHSLTPLQHAIAIYLLNKASAEKTTTIKVKLKALRDLTRSHYTLEDWRAICRDMCEKKARLNILGLDKNMQKSLKTRLFDDITVCKDGDVVAHLSPCIRGLAERRLFIREQKTNVYNQKRNFAKLSMLVKAAINQFSHDGKAYVEARIPVEAVLGVFLGNGKVFTFAEANRRLKSIIEEFGSLYPDSLKIERIKAGAKTTFLLFKINKDKIFLTSEAGRLAKEVLADFGGGVYFNKVQAEAKKDADRVKKLWRLFKDANRANKGSLGLFIYALKFAQFDQFLSGFIDTNKGGLFTIGKGA